MAAGKPICDRKQLLQVLDKLPAKDPILKLIGMADVEPFADTVEHELYG